jgi:CBS domain containing-hemolysin-like protein
MTMSLSTIEIAIRLVAGTLLILANGFFVAIEFALTRARQFTKDEFIDGNSSLERAWEMTQNLEIYLTTCQVGITASSIAVGIVAEPALGALFEPLFAGAVTDMVNAVPETFGLQSIAEPVLGSILSGAVVAFLIINLVHLTHGEQTPTYLGVERSRLVCRYGAAPLYWFHALISPIITLGDYVAKGTLSLFGVKMTGAWLETETDLIESRAELRNELGSVLDRGELSDERREEVLNALKIGEQPIREIMVSPEDIVTLSTAVDAAENLERMAENPHTRYPLVGEDFTDFRGIVYAPLLLRSREELSDGTVDFEELAAPPVTVSPDTDVSDAVDQFQAERQELALVIEDGNVVGMLTVTDCLEAVMGDIEDPIDLEIGS